MSKFTDALKKIQGERETAPIPREAKPLPAFIQAPSAETTHDDRRQSLRNRCFIQARAVISSPCEESWINQARILNFSESGMLFELEHPLSGTETLLSPDTSIRVHVILNPETHERLEVEGRVMRCFQGQKTALGIKITSDSISIPNEINAALGIAV